MYSVSIVVTDKSATSYGTCGNLELSYIEVMANSPEDAIREIADNIDEIVEQNRAREIVNRIAEKTNKTLKQWEEGLLTELDVKSRLAVILGEAYSDTVTTWYREEV